MDLSRQSIAMPIVDHGVDVLAYVAGIFDGEGCVNFCGRGRSHHIRVLVVNTNKELLDFFQQTFGGDIKHKKKRDGWKDAWEWRLQWTKAIDFLSAISPWLQVKNRQASVAFAWDAIRPGSGRKTKHQMLEHQEAVDLLSKQLSWLNKRGPAVSVYSPVDLYLMEIGYAS